MNQIEEWMNSRIGLQFSFRLGADATGCKALRGSSREAVPMIHVTGTNGRAQPLRLCANYSNSMV